MAYDPKTLELFSDLAIASAYEVKDLYYGDDPDFQLWISRIPGAYGSDASGQFLPEKDVIIVDPFVIMESDHDPCVELVNTLGHEMLHRWCQRRGIEELTPFEHPEFGRIPYHNELFRKHTLLDRLQRVDARISSLRIWVTILNKRNPLKDASSGIQKVEQCLSVLNIQDPPYHPVQRGLHNSCGAEET